MPECIRPFTTDDIDFAVAQTTREGWNTARQEFEVSLEHDHDGCFIAEMAGEPVAMVTTTRFKHTAWIGDLIVVPDHRRRGLGERMMNHAIRHIERLGIRTIQLEADPMGIGTCRRLGFVDRFQSLRLRSDAPHSPIDDHPCEGLTAENLRDVLPLDLAAYGDDRGRLVAGLIPRSLAAYLLRADGRAQGYVVAFPSPEGVRLGPWVAADRDVAARLLDRLLHDFQNAPVVTGVPGVNDAALEILKARRFTQTQPCLRMVRGGPIDDRCTDRLYAIANGAMG